jgi:outer membrane protein TolC
MTLRHPPIVCATLGFIVLLSGCAPPDRWPALEDGLLHQTPVEPLSAIALPEEIQPRFQEVPAFEMPTAGPVRLSVEQAALLALQNNRDLKVRQIDPVIAGTFEQIERGPYDPELFAEFEHEEERAVETARSTGTQFDVQATDTSAVAGVRQALPFGTTVEATVEQERGTSNRAPEEQVARLGLSVTQALLRGFGPAVNLASVRQAQLDAVASVYELRGYTEALLADTEIAYWNYILAEQEIAIFERSLAVAEQQRDVIGQRIEVGLLPQVEVAPAQSEVARRQQALIDARSLLEERRLRLLRLISLSADGLFDVSIHATSKPRIEPAPIEDLTDRLLLAEASRPDLCETRLRAKQNRLETMVTRNGLLPKLDLFIALGKTGYADTFLDTFRVLDEETNDYVVGVQLRHFLGNRTAKARDLAARAAQSQAIEAVANLRQVVGLDVRLAVNEVERARQQISASKETRMLEEETLNAEIKRFDVGASTALLVAQAQRDLLASRIAEVRAIVNYRIALVRLYLAEGSLLERRGIRISGSEWDHLGK